MNSSIFLAIVRATKLEYKPHSPIQCLVVSEGCWLNLYLSLGYKEKKRDYRFHIKLWGNRVQPPQIPNSEKSFVLEIRSVSVMSRNTGVGVMATCTHGQTSVNKKCPFPYKQTIESCGCQKKLWWRTDKWQAAPYDSYFEGENSSTPDINHTRKRLVPFCLLKKPDKMLEVFI